MHINKHGSLHACADLCGQSGVGRVYLQVARIKHIHTYAYTYIHTYLYIQIPVADGSLVEPRIAVMKGKHKDFSAEMEQLTVGFL